MNIEEITKNEKVFKAIFREGYYAGNRLARAQKGIYIMEHIISEDWNSFLIKLNENENKGS
jgi:hypothetical protein